MKPAPFEYLAPDSLPAALAALAARGWDAKLLAGGQSLIPVMNFRLAQPAVLIDLNRVAGLSGVERVGSELRIGAMTRQRTLEEDPLIERHAPLLHEAVPFIAHPQIRNRGTIGGSLAHADPAAELPALAVALDARLRLQSVRGERWVAAADFFLGLFSTVLEQDEMLTEIAIPTAQAGSGWAFVEVARRHGDYAQLGVAARITLDDQGRCSSARMVFLSAGEKPIDAKAAAALAGASLGEEVFDAVGAAARDEINPTGDIHASAAFKKHLAQVLTRRALRLAAERARKNVGGTSSR
ncbi:MAG: xanthine dehydrogenase family protein subunit M [Acidobacteriota bacterium]